MELINQNSLSAASQKKIILDKLMRGEELTSAGMLTDKDIRAVDGRKRISELRAMGYPIKDRVGYNPETKKRFNIYYMECNS
jgi:hypothetical protein